MAIGALIGAYHEDDSGGLRALLPLAGRTLLEYQVRCAAAARAAPIVVVVERVPQSLQDAFERLRLDGIGVFPVSDVQEAVSRFEAGSMILLIGDGIAPPVDLVASFTQEPEPDVGTVPDDEQH
jgi:NDP-sugar pyrophosphorylase family protein